MAATVTWPPSAAALNSRDARGDTPTMPRSARHADPTCDRTGGAGGTERAGGADEPRAGARSRLLARSAGRCQGRCGAAARNVQTDARAEALAAADPAAGCRRRRRARRRYRRQTTGACGTKISAPCFRGPCANRDSGLPSSPSTRLGSASLPASALRGRGTVSPDPTDVRPAAPRATAFY